MTDKQPEALQLAELLDRGQHLVLVERKNAATELRSLHAANVQLLAALLRIRALPVHADAIRLAHKYADDVIVKIPGLQK